MTDKEYFIVIDGEKVPVSEEVYRAFKRPAWTERKRRQVRADRERSLDVFMDNGLDIPSQDALVDEIVEDKLMLDMLFAALTELTEASSKVEERKVESSKTERDNFELDRDKVVERGKENSKVEEGRVEGKTL